MMKYSVLFSVILAVALMGCGKKDAKKGESKTKASKMEKPRYKVAAKVAAIQIAARAKVIAMAEKEKDMAKLEKQLAQYHAAVVKKMVALRKEVKAIPADYRGVFDSHRLELTTKDKKTLAKFGTVGGGLTTNEKVHKLFFSFSLIHTHANPK